MRHAHALTGLTAGAAASLMTLAASTACSQTQPAPSAENDVIVLTSPREAQVRTYTLTQPSQETRSFAITRRTGQDPAASKSQDIRIERKVVDGKEDVRLWIDGKEIEVETMEDVQKAIGEAGAQVDVDVQALDPKQPHLWRHLQVNPQDFQVELHGQMPGFEGFELAVPNFDVTQLTTLNPPKSMLGVHLEPISDDLREYLELPQGAGVRIGGVVEDSPAAKAGLQKGDIVVAVQIGSEAHDGLAIDKFREIIGQGEPGTEVSITYLRKGERRTASATLAEWDGGRLGSLTETPMLFGRPGEGIQLDAQPRLFRNLGENRIIELQPRLREVDKSVQELLKRAAPDHGEMMRMMEEQLKQMQKMLDDLRLRQDELRQELKPANASEA